MDRYTVIIAVISFFAFIQRLLREDVKWFPSLASPWRGLVVAALQMVVAPTLDAILNDASAVEALITGIISVIPTILTVIGTLTAHAPARQAAASAATKVASLTMLALLCLAGCSSVCPIIKVADEVCPFLTVELPNGQKEQVPCDRVRMMAAEQRAARLGAENGGTR